MTVVLPRVLTRAIFLPHCSLFLFDWMRKEEIIIGNNAFFFSERKVIPPQLIYLSPN